MSILLVRHAESLGNADHQNYLRFANHDLALTERGKEQARALGVFLRDWYTHNPPQNNIRLWCSPYRRVVQTMQHMRETIGTRTWNKCGRGRDVQFDERLREREWGYFSYEDHNSEDETHSHAHLFAQYRKTYQAPLGRYFARPVGGESLADVADRMRSLHHDLFFDIQNGVTDHVMMMHAASMLSFVYALTKTHPHFMTDEVFAENTGVRLLDIDPATGRFADYGMIYNPESNVYRLQRPDAPVPRDMDAIFTL